MAKYNDGSVAAPSISSTARSTSPNWHFREELTTIQRRPVVCEARMKLAPWTTLTAAENFGPGKLSGPSAPPSARAGVVAAAVPVDGGAQAAGWAAGSRCRGVAGRPPCRRRWWKIQGCRPVAARSAWHCGGADMWRVLVLILLHVRQDPNNSSPGFSCCFWHVGKAILFLCWCVVRVSEGGRFGRGGGGGVIERRKSFLGRGQGGESTDRCARSGWYTIPRVMIDG